jgi:hypothetical protein
MRKSSNKAVGRGVGTAAALMVVTATTFVPGALAAGHKASSSLGYGGPSSQQSALAPAPATKTKTKTTPATVTPDGAQASKVGGTTLPYTGADIALIGGAGVILIGFGVGAHALSRRSRTRA